MNKVNVFAVPCKEYNQETNSIIGIYNQVEIENNRMDLCVFTGINYVGSDEKANVNLDYYLQCVKDEDGTGNDGKRLSLFAISGKNRLETEYVQYGVYTGMLSHETNIPILCSGLYELQVFLTEEECLKNDSPKKRYERYKENGELPQAVARLKIKKIPVA